MRTKLAFSLIRRHKKEATLYYKANEVLYEQVQKFQQCVNEKCCNN